MYAYEKHFGQKRKSGEDYIIHPLNVAYILAGINADYKTICSALLHDTIEDCDVTKEEIEELFGGEVAYLVESLTKINKLNFSCDSEATIAKQRKSFANFESKTLRYGSSKANARNYRLKTFTSRHR